MNSIKQHVPSCVDVKPVTVKFDSTEDLLELGIVKWHVEREGFSHFALSGDHLMAIYNNGNRWWVIGYIENVSEIDLPMWEKGERT